MADAALIQPYDSLCGMHRTVCAEMGEAVSLLHKVDGVFHELSWAEYRREADAVASALIRFGIEAGDRVAILSENRYEWLVADHAVLSCGAVDVPLHAPMVSWQAAFQIQHSGARVVFVSNQTQADKLWQVVDEMPELERVISFDPIESGPLPVHDWAEVLATPILPEIDTLEAGISKSDLATIIYTSGTTGDPKGVMLTHGNILFNTEANYVIFGLDADELHLSWLPYSHVYSRVMDHYMSTWGRYVLALSGPMDALLSDMAAVQPTLTTCVPRFYEKLWAKVESLPEEQRADELKQLLGTRMRQCISGGAPLPPHVCQGFFDCGLPMIEGYGQTEASPCITFNHRGNFKVGSVGLPLPRVEVKLAGDSEILTRGPGLMQGYWRNEKASTAAVVDGWLHTGDVGRIDADQHLFIIDRKKDLIITSGGKNIAPAELERILVRNPDIDQAVVYGDGRKFVSALIVPNLESLANRAESLDQALDDDELFINEPALVAFYQAKVDEVMQAVSQPERVKRILLMRRPFQLESDELTATLKVRRRHVIAKYESHLTKLYEEK